MKHTINVEIRKRGLFSDRVEHEKRRISDSEYKRLVREGKLVGDTAVIDEEELSFLDMFIIDEILR